MREKEGFILNSNRLSGVNSLGGFYGFVPETRFLELKFFEIYRIKSITSADAKIRSFPQFVRFKP